MSQIDTNWYEGERNGMVGILPTSYVEILPNESTVCQDIVSYRSKIFYCNLIEMEQEIKKTKLFVVGIGSASMHIAAS